MAANDIEIGIEATGVSRYQADMQRASRATTQATGSMSGAFTKMAGALGAAFGAKAIFDFGKSAVMSAVKFETLNTQFSVFLGSAEKASSVLSELNKFSIETPFTPDQVNAAGRSFLAFGFTAEQLIPTMKMVGDVSAAVGKDFNELATIYGKARTAGTLYAEDINQLTEAGIPIIEELSKVMGVQADEVKKLGSQGKIHFSELEKAFGNMTSEGGRFNGMMDKMSQSTEGLMSSIEGKLQDELRGIGQAMLPTVRIIAEGFEPAFQSVKAAFIEIYTPMADAFAAFGDILNVLQLGGDKGNKFANIVGTVATALKYLTIPAQLVWKGIGKIAEGFAWAIKGMKSFQENSPILSAVVNTLLGPFTLLGDAISWVGDALGFGAAKVDATQAAYQGVVRDLAGVAKSMGATGEQTKAFAKSFDVASIAGLSQADAIKAVEIQFFNYLKGCNEATTATDKATQSVKAFTAATAGPQVGSIDYLNAKLSELKKQFTATASDLDRIKLGGQIEAIEFQLAKFGNVVDAIGPKIQEVTGLMKDASELPMRSMESLGAAFDPAAMGGALDATASKFTAFALTVKDTFAVLKDGIKSMAIDMGYTIAEAIGYAITAGGGFGDAIKAVLRDMAVQIPKMAGMALLNAATFPGNSPIALPLTVAGAALLGLSGILSGVFKGADAKKQREQGAANNSGASAVPRAAQSGLAAFVDNQQNVGQQVVDALSGTKLVLQVGDTSMDAYVKDANKRNATRQGK